MYPNLPVKIDDDTLIFPLSGQGYFTPPTPPDPEAPQRGGNFFIDCGYCFKLEGSKLN